VCVVELVDFCGHVLCKQHLIYIYKVKFIRFNFGTGHIFLTQMMYWTLQCLVNLCWIGKDKREGIWTVEVLWHIFEFECRYLIFTYMERM